MGSITQQDIEQAIMDGKFNRMLRLAMSDPIFTLSYIDGKMRGLINGPLEPAHLKWLMGVESYVRSWFWNDETKTSKMERELDVAIMREAYRYGNLFLVTGAGTSMGEGGLGGWKDLVIEVLNFALELGSEAQRTRVANNIRNNPYYLAFGPARAEQEVEKAINNLTPINAECRIKIEGVLKDLSNKRNYESDDLLRAAEVVKQCLGDDYFDHLQGILYFSHHPNVTNAHKAIADIVHPQKPRISAILTYNFDDLLEKAVWNAGKGFKAHCSRKGQWIFQNGYTEGQAPEIDIFHIHGFVPSQMRVPPDIDLVFSEKEFELAYGNDNSITQRVHQTYLSNNALGLVLGSSLTDKYAVEQMKTLYNQNPGWYHYVVIKPKDRTTGNHPREYYLAMGLRVLWIADHDEIPGLLHEIAELG